MDKEKILYQPDGYLKLLEQLDSEFPMDDADSDHLLWDIVEDID